MSKLSIATALVAILLPGFAEAECTNWYSAWPPNLEDAIGYLDDIIGGDTQFSNRYDADQLEDAELLTHGEVADLFQVNGYEWYGMTESYYGNQYYPNRTSVVGVLIPGGGVDPDQLDPDSEACEEPSDVLVILYPSTLYCGTDDLYAAWFGLTPCAVQESCGFCVCGGCQPECNPVFFDEVGKVPQEGSCTCVSSVNCGFARFCGVCYE